MNNRQEKLHFDEYFTKKLPIYLLEGLVIECIKRNSNLSFESILSKYNRELEHSEQVSQICYRIGLEMKLAPKQLRNLVIAAFLHDIGKLNIPYMILNKVEKLTTQEFDVIKKHAEYGHYILKSKDEFTMIAEYVKCHHERWDGKGYPRGIKGNRIPLISRIISVADAYEAMLAERPYRKAMNKSKAISEIVNNSGTQFDPNIVMMFQRVL